MVGKTISGASVFLDSCNLNKKGFPKNANYVEDDSFLPGRSSVKWWQSPVTLRVPTDQYRDLVTFFTGAKATEDGAWVGGFLQGDGGEIKEWFSEKVEKDWAPWLFARKDPKRVIASLELLATLIAVRLWAKESQGGSKGVCWIKAGTDNLGNIYAVNKWMSTKFPLTLLVMELSETLRARNCLINLEWVPREQNQLMVWQMRNLTSFWETRGSARKRRGAFCNSFLKSLRNFWKTFKRSSKESFKSGSLSKTAVCIRKGSQKEF